MEHSDAHPALSPTERIRQLLETVETGSPRHRALGAALDYRGSWVELARHLQAVEDAELWAEWKYDTLADYCRDELQLGRGEVRKLREGYQWAQQEAPELLVEMDAPADSADTPPSRPPTPDIDTIDQLARGWQDYQQERIPEDTYLELKRAALSGERSAYQLRRDFKEAIPEHLRERPAPNPRKHLKRALDALEKALNDVAQDEDNDLDPELLERMRQLRDEIFHLVAHKPDED